MCCALHLQKYELKILLIEKQSYPKHKVCGEYVSNEVLPYLGWLNIDPKAHGAVPINQFEISTRHGETIESGLPLGGFGMSRYALDTLLYNEVVPKSEVVIDTVTSVEFQDNIFVVNTQSKKSFQAPYAVGAFGKRSILDKQMDRKFVNERTHWMAVKAHYDYSFPENKVALHNFEGGYCGLSQTETGAVNACYLTTLKSFRACDSLEEFQQKVMSENSRLKDFFENAIPLFEKPLTISQISFAKKSIIEDHIFMLGDSAGLIHPLCGNGMAMAIHSAKLFSELYLKEIRNKNGNRDSLEHAYKKAWKANFAERLRTGSRIQRLLLNNTAASFAYTAVNRFPSILPYIIKKTHGTALV
ncbi:MAG: FAD-dependent oxidoreductase [Flavobacteriaceae bacterium]|nr:FAD-dependent oxidoreductase [Flavobacteriaceae bacterium]